MKQLNLRKAGAVVAALLMISSVVAIGGVTAAADSGTPEGAAVVSESGVAASNDTGEDSEAASKPDPKVSSEVKQLIEAAQSGESDSELVTHDNGQTFITVRIDSVPGRSDEVSDVVRSNNGQVRNELSDLVIARLPVDALNSLKAASAVTFVRTPERVDPAAGAITSEGLANMNVTSELHAQGINGSGVTVAVIDSGFNASNLEIEGNVVEMKNFTLGGGPFTNKSGQHGSATSELVVDTAPNVSLILIQVAYVSDIRTAIDHIEQNTSADIVSMSLGVRTGPFDGTSNLDNDIEASVNNGTTWFVSSGNDADGQHLTVDWNDPDGNQYLNFSGKDETLSLLGSPTSGVIFVNWDDFPGSNEDYDIYLYNDTGGLVAYSENPQTGSQRPVEIVSWSGESASHLVIKNHSANGTAQFNIFTADGLNLEYNTSSRSVGRPATEEKVISVGSVHYSDNGLEPFSSRGPTSDGQLKPEVVAPDGVSTSIYGDGPNGFFGTSAAAPHAAGVAALLVDVDPSLIPGEIRDSLTASATRLDGTAPNNQTGYGLVNATGAVEVVSSGGVSIKHQTLSTTSDGVNISKQVAISTDTNLTLDNGTNYEFKLIENDTGQSVTLVINGTFKFNKSTPSPLGFWVNQGDGSASLNPEMGPADQTLPADVVNGSIPNGSGLVNYSVVLLDADTGETISRTGVEPAVLNYTGRLHQNSTTGTVELSVPNDTVPSDAEARVYFSRDSFDSGTTYERKLTFVDGAAEFQTHLNASNFTAGNYSWRVDFRWQNVRVMGMASHFLGGNLTLEGGPTADTTAPNVSDAQATDLTDFDGNVTHGDTVKVNVTADDNGSGLQSVTTNASHFGNDSVPLTDPDGDGRFNGTFTVNGAQASPNGSYPITVVATDGSGNTNSTTTNSLQLNTSGDVTAPQITKYSVQNIGFHEYQLTLNSSEQLSEITLRITDSKGNTVRTLDKSDFSESGSGPYTYTNFSTKLDDAGTYTFTLEAANDSAGNNGGGNSTTVSIVVDSVNITANQSIDRTHLGFDIALSGGLLQVQLQNSTQQFAPAKYDLRSLGATSSTQFWINITVLDYTPRLILGAGRNAEWNVTHVGQNTTAINISVTPANVQYNESKLFNPDRPWSESEHADVSANVSVGMAIADLSFMSESRRNLFNDTMLMTDAQEFGTPQYDEANQTLRLFVAAPHFNVKRNVNQGFFDAFIPQPLLDDWGVADPSEINVTSMGNTTKPASTEVTEDGIRLFIPIEYSSGNVELAPNQTAQTTEANLSIEQADGFGTGKGGLNQTKQVGFSPNKNLTFDNGTNYHIRLTNEDSGNSVTLAVNGSVTVSAGDRIGLMVYEGDGAIDPEPGIWAPRQQDVQFPAEIVSGSVPSAQGATNFSVAILNASTGEEINRSETRISVVGYHGVLRQNDTTGLVRLHLPRDVVPKPPTVDTVELVISEGDLHDGSQRYSLDMALNSTPDTFEAIVNASNFNTSTYSWEVFFKRTGFRILQVRSPGSANPEIVLQNGSGDVTPPSITNAKATDLTDGDGNVSDGDTVEVSAKITDAGAGVHTVIANATAFGAAWVTLTDDDGDDVYNTTFAVVESNTDAPEGPHATTVVANDSTVGDGNVNVSDTNPLTLKPRKLTLSGRVENPDTSAAEGDFVVAKNATSGVFSVDTADSNGNYAVTVNKDELTSLTFVQGEVFDANASQRDGVVDLFEFDEKSISSDTDIGTTTLPEGHALNVTVVNESGVPVENATVGITHNSDPDVESHGINTDTNAKGLLQFGAGNVPGIEVLGNVSVTVRPPTNETVGRGDPADAIYADQEVVKELTVTSDESITVTLDEAVEVSGRLLKPDGSPATGDIVFTTNGSDTDVHTNQTDDSGNFSVEASRGEPVSFGVFQLNGTDGTAIPRDGVVDLYEFAEGTFSESSELSDRTLPKGHVLNVTVVNQSGVPVENASVLLKPENQPNVQSVGPGILTNAQGMLQADNQPPGIELNGSVTVEVEPPEDASGFVDQTQTKELNVTNATSINVTLLEVDVVPPTIDNASVVDADDGDTNITDGDVVEISADVADEKRDVDSVFADASAFGAGNVSLTDDNGDGTYNATFTVDASNAGPDGANVVDIHANDTENNWNATVTNNLTLDTEPPVFLNSSVDPGAVLDANTTVTVNYTDVASGVNASAVTVLVNGSVTTAATATTSSASFDMGSLGVPDGTHNITVVLVDRVGLSTASSANLTLDSTAPTVTELSHSGSGGHASTNAPTTITVNISEPHPANATFRIENATTGDVVLEEDASAAFDGPTEGTWDATNGTGVPVPTGTYTAILVANDTVGHSTTSSITIDVDNTAPSIDSVVPADGELVNTSEPDLTAAYSDADAGVNASAVRLGIDGSEVTLDASNVSPTTLSTTLSSLSISDPDNSSHTYTLVVVDNASNSVQITRNFTVDTEPPRLGLDSELSNRISTNNPTTLTITRSDAHPNATTFVIENATTGTVVETRDLTGKLGDGSTTIEWNATDGDGTAVKNGDYELRLTSDDRAGNANATNITVTVDNTKPTATFVALNTSGASQSPAGQTFYTNDTVGFNATADGTPGEAANVTLRLSATAVNFKHDTAGTLSNGHWTAVADLSGVPDDGEYEAIPVVVDPANNRNTTTANATVVLDREAPELGTTVSRVNDTTGRVNLTIADGNPPVDASALTVAVTLPNGTTVTVDMTSPSDSAPQWTGTFALGSQSGDFEVVATGVDNASNRGRATASATIQQVSTENNTVTVQVKETGTFVRFNTSQEVQNSFVSLTASESSLAPLSENLTGVSFLNGQLGDALDANLTNATIGVPVNTSQLPSGVDKDNATIGFFNETSGEWELLNTTTRTLTINGTEDEYWVTNVTHFSTYGAVAQDTSPPTLTSKSPSAGTEFSYGTTEVTARFEYTDAVTGVDASAVTMEVDGTAVTGDAGTQITSNYAEHTATGLSTGTHTVNVTVVDEAGNKRTFSTSFTIPADDAAPTVQSSSPADGKEFAAGTSQVTMEVSYEDTQSGVDTSAVVVTFDGSDVTGAASVTSTKVSYTATGLSDNSSHKLEVTLVDNDGNSDTKSLSFSIAEPADTGGDTDDDSTDGGASGGGSSATAPPVNVDVSTTDAGISANIENAGSGEPVSIDVPADAGSISEGVSLSTMEITPMTSGDFEIGLAAGQGDAPRVSDVEPALGYLEISHTIDDADVQTVTLRFTVSDAELQSKGIAPEAVSMYRYHDGEWTELDTTLVESTDGTHRYAADSPGLSVFAISRSGSGPAFSVTEAAVQRTTVEAGESVDITATVENTGDRSGTVALELTVDGEVVASREVTVAAGDSQTVTFSRTFSTAGSYDVAVEDLDAGTVTVESVSTPATRTTRPPTTTAPPPETTEQPDTPEAAVTDASPATAPPSDEPDGGLPASPVTLSLIAVIVLVALAIVARRRL